ncbi:MAG TPA: helix-turn-helix domain-containing protein [Candidatus Babeliales bacterium]|nr:helix-turn-helix domain-containing protein [Candidatus Babeliales bacterium]
MSVSRKKLIAEAPSSKEMMLAGQSGRLIADYLRKHKTITLHLAQGKQLAQQVVLPAGAAQLLANILEQMSQGKTVSIFATGTELTIQEAATLLNVSRAYMLKLVKQGVIPYHKLGNSYRLLAQDVIHYKTVDDKKRFKALAALSRQAQDLNMGY